jgi:hypothetical protein
MTWRRIVLAGIAAGGVINLFDLTTNFVVFRHSWGLAYDALHLAPDYRAVGIFWLSFNFASGVIIAWLQAALRPRYGPGAGTSVRAALVFWIILHGTMASHVADGVFPIAVLAGTAACELVSNVVAALVARRLLEGVRPLSEDAVER